MKEYIVNFIFDYVIITSNPIFESSEEKAIIVAKSFVYDSGLDISNVKHNIDVEVF